MIWWWWTIFAAFALAVPAGVYVGTRIERAENRRITRNAWMLVRGDEPWSTVFYALPPCRVDCPRCGQYRHFNDWADCDRWAARHADEHRHGMASDV